MRINRTMSMENLREFDFEATKRNVNSYFVNLEALEWEYSKLNAQRGLTANYDFSEEHRGQPYIKVGKDAFNVSAKELTEAELKSYLANYYWAISILTELEQLYLMEYFINQKYEDEIVDLLGFNNSDSTEFKRLKRSAIFKFADFLNLVVSKEVEKKEGVVYAKKRVNRNSH